MPCANLVPEAAPLQLSVTGMAGVFVFYGIAAGCVVMAVLVLECLRCMREHHHARATSGQELHGIAKAVDIIEMNVGKYITIDMDDADRRCVTVKDVGGYDVDETPPPVGGYDVDETPPPAITPQQPQLFFYQ